MTSVYKAPSTQKTRDNHNAFKAELKPTPQMEFPAFPFPSDHHHPPPGTSRTIPCARNYMGMATQTKPEEATVVDLEEGWARLSWNPADRSLQVEINQHHSLQQTTLSHALQLFAPLPRIRTHKEIFNQLFQQWDDYKKQVTDMYGDDYCLKRTGDPVIQYESEDDDVDVKDEMEDDVDLL